MTMPYYASPEQLMRDRSELARKGIARGRSVVVLTYAAMHFEQQANPLLTQLGVDSAAGNMEGKETRFGIAESGLFMRNYLGVANTVRAGARSASASGNDASSDLYLVNSMAQESSALPRGAIQYIVVYKATGFGAGPVNEGSAGVPAGCLAGQARAGMCNVYTPAHFSLAATQIAEETRHRAAVEAGSFGTTDLGFGVEGPIVQDKLAFRFDVSQYETDGQYRNALNAEKLGQRRTRDVSAMLYATPFERFSAKLRLHYWEDDDGAPSSSSQ